MPIPVIDLFAGPGGLGEGFSRDSLLGFKVAVSIEKDRTAHQTLRLRAAHRALVNSPGVSSRNWVRWDDIVQNVPWERAFHELSTCGDALIEGACAEADLEALNLELGPLNRKLAKTEIQKRLAPFMSDGRLPRNIVLIGGPPCQAYSVVGRSRNKGTPGYRAEEDHRHFLYMEYLHVIAAFEPAVFVMENVKGILSSKVENARIFQTIVRDLKQPGAATKTATKVEYVLCTLGETQSLLEEPDPHDFIVRAEEHGVPQARHRVIILGVRRDVFDAAGGIGKLRRSRPPSVKDVVWDLPKLRPELSFRGKGKTWMEFLKEPLFGEAVRELRATGDPIAFRVAGTMLKIRKKLEVRQSDPGPGKDRLRWSSPGAARPQRMATWLQDRRNTVLANHESRSHMPTDLIRYLFVSAFGQIRKESPRLVDFPKCLLPDHKNVDPEHLDESPFKDRFRVQIRGRHAMTITSHIAKDGHAFIHPQPTQCRSLTVREAARLQTFPDSYVFLGGRTAQYTQVGNAVPPYLARQIAVVVRAALELARLTSVDVEVQSDAVLLAA
jgi:DNA (cytosine-5)-methyltransferase 1